MNEVEIKQYGTRRYARVENLDDILELLLQEALKQGMVGGGQAQHENEQYLIKVDIKISKKDLQ